MRATLRLLALTAACAGLACSDSAPPPEAAPPSPPAPAPQAPAPPPAPAAPPSGSVDSASAAPDASRGKLQFENYCVSCHGPRGEGDGPVAASLPDPKPARLGDRAYMSAKTDDYLFQVIKGGGASVGRSPLMAPWGGTLSDAQIRDVIAYIRSLAH